MAPGQRTSTGRGRARGRGRGRGTSRGRGAGRGQEQEPSQAGPSSQEATPGVVTEQAPELQTASDLPVETSAPELQSTTDLPVERSPERTPAASPHVSTTGLSGETIALSEPEDSEETRVEGGKPPLPDIPPTVAGSSNPLRIEEDDLDMLAAGIAGAVEEPTQPAQPAQRGQRGRRGRGIFARLWRRETPEGRLDRIDNPPEEGGSST